MESNPFSNGLYLSGVMSADCTLLLTDVFNLFPASFQKLLPMLETRYRVLSYGDNGFDIFNRTQQLRHPTIAGYANDLIASLQEKKIHSVTYLAHSVNALIAFQAAHTAPQLFDKIILLNAIPYLKEDAKEQYQCGFKSTESDSVLFEHLILSEENLSEQFTSLLRTAFAKISREKAQLIFRFLLTADCRTHLKKLTMPVMILQGTGDKIVTNEAAFFMHRRIPESYIVKVRAKGHLPQQNAPEEIYRAIEIFMYPACINPEQSLSDFLLI